MKEKRKSGAEQKDGWHSILLVEEALASLYQKHLFSNQNRTFCFHRKNNPIFFQAAFQLATRS
jgi:hypothetical protein